MGENEKSIQMVKKNILFFFMLILSISLVSSIEYTFQQDTAPSICHPARLDGEISTSMTCNLTVYYPNGTTLIDFQPMTDLNDRFCYNLTNNDTAVKGEYDYEVTCSTGTQGGTEPYSYLVNLGGIEPTAQRTDATSRTIYIFLGLALITFISFLYTKKTPIKATLFLLMIWFILMGVNAAYISIQDEVINSSIENFFSFFLTISFWANYAIFFSIAIIWLITFIVNLLDSQAKKLEKEYG